MKTIALFSIKGGVGKTAVAVNLAHAAACDGRRTLLVDLDPQGAASFYFRVRPRPGAGKRVLLDKGQRADHAIRATDFDHLDILPAHRSFRRLELALADLKKPHKQLRRWLEPRRDQYDLVVLDCPPTLTLVAESVLRAADLVLVPVIPTVLSERTLVMLLDHCQRDELDPARLAPFFCLADRRKALHRRLLTELPATVPMPFLTTVIPTSTEIERMGLERRPVACFAPKAAGTMAVQALWAEVSTRLDGR